MISDFCSVGVPLSIHSQKIKIQLDGQYIGKRYRDEYYKIWKQQDVRYNDCKAQSCT